MSVFRAKSAIDYSELRWKELDACQAESVKMANEAAEQCIRDAYDSQVRYFEDEISRLEKQIVEIDRGISRDEKLLAEEDRNADRESVKAHIEADIRTKNSLLTAKAKYVERLEKAQLKEKLRRQEKLREQKK